jgi:hypothetical protein
MYQSPALYKTSATSTSAPKSNLSVVRELVSAIYTPKYLPFPKQTISAFTENKSCDQPFAKRNPVITSSKISKALFSVQIFLNASKKPFFGGIQPIFPATGSIIIAAISFLFASKRVLTLCISLYYANKVSFAVPCVTPGLLGTPKVLAPLPAEIKKESECP